MLSLLHKIRYILVSVVFIFLIQSSASSYLENDKMAQLIERFDRMQTKIDAMRIREEVLEVENAQLTGRLDEMQTKMDFIRRRVEVLEVENYKWIRKFGDLEAENEKLKTQMLQKDEESQYLNIHISHPKLSLPSPNREDGQSPRVLSSPPTSCQELKNQNGKIWPMDGIHLLKKTNKIQAAFCTFPADGSPVSEALIGQVTVKTKPVYFYVQRSTIFNKQNAVIPFELTQINEENAFNISSGIFTVSVPGIYHFDFSAVKDISATYLSIFLQVNGVSVGIALTSQPATGSRDGVSLSTSLRLAAGDRVNLLLWGGVLFDNTNHYTHFTGWLVEEDLM